jgi:pyruvate dehydrogenase E2 component (dihydrolipoamide acetyltransferase)
MPTTILMPALSPTMQSGTLAKWIKCEGDPIKPGDVIAEIETDKAIMEFEAIDEGKIGKILIASGTEGVSVNDPIAIFLEVDEDDTALEGFVVAGTTESNTAELSQTAASNNEPTELPEQKQSEDTAAASNNEPTELPEQKQSEDTAATSNNELTELPEHKQSEDTAERIFASPLARRMANQNGIDLNTISGSGPHGRIVKRDIELTLTPDTPLVLSDPETSPLPSDTPKQYIDPRQIYPEDSYVECGTDNMRKTISRRLSQSFSEVPHFSLNIDCDIDALLMLRSELNAASQDDGGSYKISINDIILKASSLALLDEPEANASWAGNAILHHKHADIGVAVAIDGGLITPIVWRTETKGLATISAEVKALTSRAKERKLQPHEYLGGTFSVSNLGMLGISSFTSILNQPQGAIMSVGAGEKRAVVRNNALAMANMMTITLTCDHRAIDGVIGARFLSFFKKYIENPTTMML